MGFKSNPSNAQISSYKPWRPNSCVHFESIVNVLVRPIHLNTYVIGLCAVRLKRYIRLSDLVPHEHTGICNEFDVV